METKQLSFPLTLSPAARGSKSFPSLSPLNKLQRSWPVSLFPFLTPQGPTKRGALLGGQMRVTALSCYFIRPNGSPAPFLFPPPLSPAYCAQPSPAQWNGGFFPSKLRLERMIAFRAFPLFSFFLLRVLIGTDQVRHFRSNHCAQIGSPESSLPQQVPDHSPLLFIAPFPVVNKKPKVPVF